MKKRSIIIGVLVIMLAITGYLNHIENKKQIVSNDTDEYIPVGEAVSVSSNFPTEKNNFFTKAKIDRESERTKAIELLNDIINNPNSTEESKIKAEDKLSAISDNIILETTSEGLIAAKGYNSSVVYINDSSINVVVETDNLSASDTAKIREIIYEQTNNNNIKIVAVN